MSTESVVDVTSVSLTVRSTTEPFVFSPALIVSNLMMLVSVGTMAPEGSSTLITALVISLVPVFRNVSFKVNS